MNKFQEGIIFIILIAVIMCSVKLYVGERSRRINLEESVLASLDSIEFYKGAYRRKVINPTRANFKTLYKADIDSFKKETGRPRKALKQLLKATVERRDSISIVYRDSTLFDTIPVKCFIYNDPWLSIDGCNFNDSGYIKYNSRLSLKSYTYKKRKKEKWYKPWKWGTELTSDIRSNNPNDTVTDLEHIIVNEK